jgi:hypothetical protein
MSATGSASLQLVPVGHAYRPGADSCAGVRESTLDERSHALGQQLCVFGGVIGARFVDEQVGPAWVAEHLRRGSSRERREHRRIDPGIL